MALVLNEDEVMMRDMAQGFFAEKAPVKALRDLRDTQDETRVPIPFDIHSSGDGAETWHG